MGVLARHQAMHFQLAEHKNLLMRIAQQSKMFVLF